MSSVLNLRLVLQGVDRAMGPIRRIRESLRVMEREDADRHRRVMGRLRAVGDQYRRLGVSIASATGRIIGAATAGFGALTTGVFITAGQFERWEAVLVGLEGSSAAARRSMAWVTEFARTTPYEISQVMDAFVRLRAYGIDPTDGTLRTLGDTASTMGKDLMDAIEMMADAQSGEYERLKEFGIRATQQGDRVRFSFVQNGRQMEVSAARTGTAITETLLGIFSERNAGAMDRQSRTMFGLGSGLMDWLTSFKRMIADAGVGDFMREQMSGILAQLNTPEGQAQAQALASEISGALIDGIRELRAALEGIDVGQLISGLVAIVTFIPKVIEFFGGLQGLVTALGTGAILKIGLDLGMVGATLAGIAGVAAGPIIATIAIITALGAVAFLIWRNWDRVKGFFVRLWTGMRQTFSAQVRNISAFLRAVFSPVAMIMRPWEPVVAWFQRRWTALKSAFERGVRAVWNILPAWFRSILSGTARFSVDIMAREVARRDLRPSIPRGRAQTGPLARQEGWRGSGDPAAGVIRRRPAEGPPRVDGVIDVRIGQDGQVRSVRASTSTPGLQIRAPRGRLSTDA